MTDSEISEGHQKFMSQSPRKEEEKKEAFFFIVKENRGGS